MFPHVNHNHYHFVDIFHNFHNNLNFSIQKTIYLSLLQHNSVTIKTLFIIKFKTIISNS